MKSINIKLSFLSCLLFFSQIAISQISSGGTPESFEITTPGFDDNIPTKLLPSFDVDRVRREAEAESGIYRMGELIPVDYTIRNSGSWQSLPNGDRIWRLKVQADDQAKGLNPYFDDFYLPEGTKLYLYNEFRELVLGAFTNQNNPVKGNEFVIDHIRDNNFIIEYYEPADTKEQVRLSLSEIGYAFRGITSIREARDFGDSGSCNINVNCSPVGDDWQDEKHGIARILVRVAAGQGWCSGSLINNIRQDCKPYFLTALHCAVDGSQITSTANFNQWIFYFDYEASGCSNPANQPAIQSVTGCTVRSYGLENDAARFGSDYLFVELNTVPPSSYNVYYNGWNARNVSTNAGVGLHHPSGDIMKISTFSTALTSDSWTNPDPITHWRVVWSTNANGWGITEPGSSGSALFNNQAEIIGTLSAGGAACSSQSSPDIYGKVSWHWTSNGAAPLQQLKGWLDPDNTGALAMSGTYAPCTACQNTITVSSSADSGPGSLREAIANICPDGTITVDAGLVVSLSSPIPISKSMSIQSADQSVGSTIDGGGNTRLFTISSNYPKFFGINFTGGNESAIRIMNASIFTRNCNFYNNTSSVYGGAIDSENSNVWAYNTSYYSNSAGFAGGAVASRGTSGLYNVVNCTYYDNSCDTGSGGAIGSYGLGHDMTINFSTFYANAAGNAGGAIYEEGNTVNSKASIYYGNSASNAAIPNFNIVGTFESSGSNIFDIANGANTLNLDPSDLVNADPKLGTLVGPQPGSGLICQTIEIAPWGAAFNAASDCIEINTNAIGSGANGVPRPTNGSCDIGAHEYRETTAGCDAISSLTCGASVGDNTGSFLYFSCDESASYSVLYEYIPTFSGNLNLSLHSFTGDLDLYLYDADLCGSSCSSLDESTTSDDTESIEYTVSAGTTYYVLVWGFDGTQTSYSLDAVCPTPPLACDNPIAIGCGETIAETNAGIYQEFDYTCWHSADSDGIFGYVQGYNFTAQFDGDITIDLTDMVVDVEDLDLFLHNGDPCDANCIEQSSGIGVQNEQIIFTASAGVEYFIAVRGYEQSQGTYNLTLTCTDPCEEDIILASPADDIPGAAFFFATNKSIFATNKITGISSVDYSAGSNASEAIYLNEEFEVGLGAVFNAYAEGCLIPTRQEDEQTRQKQSRANSHR